MKTFIPAIIAYAIACIIIVLLPASEGYDSIAWKLLVGQIFAVPIFFAVALISIRIKKKKDKGMKI